MLTIKMSEMKEIAKKTMNQNIKQIVEYKVFPSSLKYDKIEILNIKSQRLLNNSK